MRLKTLWIWRKGDDGAEMIEAWDEYCADANRQGFDEACAKALAACGQDVWQHRYIDIEIDYEKVQLAFAPGETTGEVVST